MHVSLILFPGFPLLAHVLAQEVLCLANECAGRPLFSWQIRTVTGAPVPSRDGGLIAADLPGWTAANGSDLVLLCAGEAPLRYLPLGLRGLLMDAEAAGATLGGLDTGGVILARLGYLKGRRAALDRLATEHCSDQCQEIALSGNDFVIDRNRLTARGGLAVAGAMLDWIAQVQSAELAAQTAKRLGLSRVSGADTQPPAPQSSDPVLDQMQAIMAAHIEKPIPVEQISADLDLSPKQLRLRCRKALGQTPTQIYHGIRLDRAAQLVDGTELSVLDIARAAGFASPSGFTRSYHARFGVAPRTQRRKRWTGNGPPAVMPDAQATPKASVSDDLAPKAATSETEAHPDPKPRPQFAVPVPTQTACVSDRPRRQAGDGPGLSSFAWRGVSQTRV